MARGLWTRYTPFTAIDLSLALSNEVKLTIHVKHYCVLLKRLPFNIFVVELGTLPNVQQTHIYAVLRQLWLKPVYISHKIGNTTSTPKVTCIFPTTVPKYI